MFGLTWPIISPSGGGRNTQQPTHLAPADKDAANSSAKGPTRWGTRGAHLARRTSECSYGPTDSQLGYRKTLLPNALE